MRNKLDKFSPLLNRIVTLSVILTLTAQIVLVYIGLTYAHSIETDIDAKRTENVLDQVQQNILYLLNDVNNILLLLQTPEFSDFFENLMNLRDSETVFREQQKLLKKLDRLNISSDIIDSIYFIGANINQKSYRKGINSSRFEELPHLRMDLFHYSKLDDLFLPDHDQFTLYSENDFRKHFHPDSQLLDKEDVIELQAFISRINGRVILSNGNENGVFIFIVLNDRFIQQALPLNNTEETPFSVVSSDNRVLWSTVTRKGDEASPNTVKELLPFKLRIVHFEKQGISHHFRSVLFIKMVGLSFLTLLFTLFVSLFYLKKVFKPFRIISKRLRNQFMTSEKLKTLPEGLVKKGFHSISLRSKLILILCAAVSIPVISDGFLYSRFFTQDVQRKMETFVNTIGDMAIVSIRNQVQLMGNILNEISASQKFQDYVTAREPFHRLSNVKDINLSMFPGLNDVSYFVLLDEDGNCIYSSIFSNNTDIFDTEPKYLLKREDPYWISNYKDVFNHISTALVKRIGPNSENNRVTYMMLVPKEYIFENAESGQINASYVISDDRGQTIYRSRLLSDFKPAELFRFSKDIPETIWHISIDYFFKEFIDKKSGYQKQFLLCLCTVFLLSAGVAILIANIMARPIKQLMETMQAVGAGDFARRVVYDENNEIGDIIKGFNRMVHQLENTIQKNMRIMEENSKNKIRENDLMAMKTRAELQMLQAQINPHFLYNTLEAINMRSLKSGNHEISAIVSALADLFRYSISKGTDAVKLETELKHVNNYLTIQQIRFGHNFAVEYNIPEELKGTMVLRFILQPIVENSIKHGFEGWETGGSIQISALKIDDRIQLRLSDNGIGISTQTLEQLKAKMEGDLGGWKAENSGIGLNNVYHRLKLFYKEQMSMSVSSELMRGTVVILEFPLSFETS